MHISGSGHIPAGEYNDKISISGSGRLDGNIRCTSLSVSGSAHCAGDLACTEDIRVSGSGHFGGSVTSTDMEVSGSASVGGNVKCGVLHCAGSIRVEKGLEAEEFRSAGMIRCGELLNAETVDVVVEQNSHSEVGSIGGGEIRIHRREKNRTEKRRQPLLARLLGGHSTDGSLTVSELVEGDVVALECVKAPTVVGRVVAIGAGCEIGLVQYTEECEIHPDAKVEHCEKI